MIPGERNRCKVTLPGSRNVCIARFTRAFFGESWDSFMTVRDGLSAGLIRVQTLIRVYMAITAGNRPAFLIQTWLAASESASRFSAECWTIHLIHCSGGIGPYCT